MNEAPVPEGKDLAGKWVLAVILVAMATAFGYVGWGIWNFSKATQEWHVLRKAAAEFAGRPYTQMDFMESHGFHLVCVRGISGERIWILLDGKCDSLYKQHPTEGQYDLTQEDCMKIVKSCRVSKTVHYCLWSHVVDRPRGS